MEKTSKDNDAVTMTIKRIDLVDLILACRILDSATDADVTKWDELHDMLQRILISFDDKSEYENVLPNAVFFQKQQYVATDAEAAVWKRLRGKIHPGAHNPELREVLKSGDTHADLSTMPKVR